MIAAEGYYFSPIGGGEKVHIFDKRCDTLDALCLRGPAFTLWYEAHDDEICKACLREYEKEKCK